MAEPTKAEMNRFVREVDEFMQKNRILNSSEYQNIVYNSNDPSLIADYENAVIQFGRLRSTIIATVGVWSAAKQRWASVIDVTSTAIGDAIDEIRSWFGYEPAGQFAAYTTLGDLPRNALSGLSALGIVQLPAAAWVAGIISAAYLANTMMSKIFVRIETARLVRSGMPRAEALQVASSALAPTFFRGINIPLVAGGLLAIFLLMTAKPRKR